VRYLAFEVEAAPVTTEPAPTLLATKLVVESIEGEWANVEWGEQSLVLPTAWLPPKATVNDYIRLIFTPTPTTSTIELRRDNIATRNALKYAQERLDTLTSADTGQDLAL
jgi:hypothetical protein